MHIPQSLSDFSNEMYEIIFLTGLCLILIYFLKQYTSRNDDVISGIPAPSLIEFVVHMFRNRAQFGDVLKILNGLHNKLGPTFLIHFKPLSPILVTSDRNYFGQILASKEYLHKSAFYAFFKNIIGDSILTVQQVDIWRNDRKLLNEVFGHESFKVFLENLDQKLYILEGMLLEKKNAPVDMQNVLHNFTLHTTLDSLKDPSVVLNPHQANQYKRNVHEYLKTFTKAMLPLTLNLQNLFKMTPTYKKLDKQEKDIRQYAMDMIDAHLEIKDKQSIDTNNIIYKMHEAGVPYSRIVDNLLVFIEAAHETVATTLAYLFFELARNPDVQNKMCAEISSITGNDPNSTISPADIQQMKYINCVAKEGLRLYAPVPYIFRELQKPAEVNNVTLPQGTTIVFFIDALHKSEKYYKDPLLFDPDRFSEENKSNLMPNSWAPFSLGIRNCIGKTLAMQKMKLILAKMVRKYEFLPVVPKHELDIKSAFVTSSVNGVPVIVKPREVNRNI